jgi:hypothetical protein
MVWKLQDVKTNSQNWAQDEVNLHKKERNKPNLNKKRTWLMKIGLKMVHRWSHGRHRLIRFTMV